MKGAAGRRDILFWCLYDFADSSFTTIVVTVGYSTYFRSVVAASAGPRATFYWGVCVAASMLLVALTSPFMGALADASGRKKPLLALYASTAIVFTALLSTVGPGDILAGMLLFIVANVGYEGAHIFYNGFLPEIASESALGRVSGYGWALGYIGGLAALVLTLPFASAAVGDPGYRVAFLVVALFYLVFALPMMFVPERAPRGPGSPLRQARIALARLRQTFHSVRRLPDLFRFLLAFFAYNEAITTVIAFSAIFAVEVVGFSLRQVYVLFIVMQLVAFAGSVVAGHLADRYGARPVVAVAVLIWCAVVVGAFFVHDVKEFFVVGTGAALGMGSAQAASRSLMALLVPAGRNAEYFGFYGLTGKVSAVFGPLLYGWAVPVFGGERQAILTLLPFFVAGLLLLLTVDVRRGRAAAGTLPAANPAGAAAGAAPVAS